MSKENKINKTNKGSVNIAKKLMAGLLAGLMLFSLCITPIAYLIAILSK